MAYNFVVNGGLVDLYDGSQVIVSLDASTRPFTWTYDDAGRIRFTIAGNVYEVASYTDIQFEGAPLSSLDDFGTQIAAVFTGYSGSSSPTEFLYVSSPVNKVFRLDGTQDGKNKYTDPDDATNYLFWTGSLWRINLGGIEKYYNLQDTTYPESQNWLLVADDSPAPLSITRYHGTLQEVLEQISKPKEWPKVYRALLTQSGTDAPVATVLENTLGGDITWSYIVAGAYSASLAGLADSGKILAFLGGTSDGNEIGFGNAFVIGTDINVQTFKYDGTPTNAQLNGTPIQILVYP